MPATNSGSRQYSRTVRTTRLMAAAPLEVFEPGQQLEQLRVLAGLDRMLRKRGEGRGVRGLVLERDQARQGAVQQGEQGVGVAVADIVLVQLVRQLRAVQVRGTAACASTTLRISAW